MISFASDYIAGAHPKILEKFIETNLEPLTGYGTDIYCDSAKKKILEACKCENGQVYFISGGTQTNKIVIDTMVDETYCVIAAKTGHIAVHEAGAIEFSGHKVIELPSYDGLLKASDIKEFMVNFFLDDNHDSMPEPSMVYISYPSEYGTLYTKKEIEDIYSVCKEYGLNLFIDGARLGYGLMSHKSDITLEDLPNLCDVFYIGGTKVGALCGEALVFTHNNMPKRFFSKVKAHGALLAKGRLMGISFDVLFTDNLYMNISKHAIDLCDEMIKIFKEKGYRFYLDSPTNQQFIILENNKLKELEKQVCFGFWEKYDDNHTVVRFATSWSTTKEDIEKLRELL